VMSEGSGTASRWVSSRVSGGVPFGAVGLEDLPQPASSATTQAPIATVIGLTLRSAARGVVPAGDREASELLFVEVQIDMMDAMRLPQLADEPVARRAIAQLHVVRDLQPPAVVTQ